MASDRKPNFHKYQDDDLNESLHAQPSAAAAAQHSMQIREEMADAGAAHHGQQQHIESHMGGDRFGRGGQHHIANQETRMITITEFVSLEQLESGRNKLEIGDLQADLFRRVVFDEATKKVSHAGDVKRAQITRVLLTGYSLELPVDAAITFSSVSGELTSEAVKTQGARNGRQYPLIVKRESAAKFGDKDAVLIYSNDKLLDKDLLEKFGNLNKDDLRVGLTPHPTDPAITMFDYKKNKLVHDMVKRHRVRLEETFESFSFAELQHEADVLGRDVIQIPTEVVDKLLSDVTTHGIGAVEEGTGPLARACISLESPTGKSGSFSDVRSILAGKTGLDAQGVDRLMHVKHQIDFDLVVSAVIPGAGAP